MTQLPATSVKGVIASPLCRLKDTECDCCPAQAAEVSDGRTGVSCMSDRSARHCRNWSRAHAINASNPRPSLRADREGSRVRRRHHRRSDELLDLKVEEFCQQQASAALRPSKPDMLRQ